MPTEIGRWQLRCSSAHSDLAVEVQQCDEEDEKEKEKGEEEKSSVKI